MMKIIKRILIGCICVLLIAVAGIYGMWHNEIGSIMSIQQIVPAKDENQSGPVYVMDVQGDYYFDDFLAQGGVSNDSQLIDFVVGNITKGIIPVSLSAPEIGCSSFTAVDKEGKRYFARNYDFSTTSGMIVRTAPGNGRYASISSVDLQFLGIKDGAPIDGFMQKVICLAAPYVPIDGMNEAGVAVGIYMSYQGDTDNVTATDQNTDRPDLTSTTMLRMILDYAGSVDEAIQLVSQYDLHDSAGTSFHYMVADSTGASAILEWTYGSDHTDNDGSRRELKVYRNDQDEMVGVKEAADEYQYVTNFIVTPDYYELVDDMKGLDRYQMIQETVNPDETNTAGLFEKNESLFLLETIGRRKWDAQKGESDQNHITVWSALYDLTDRSVTWVSNEEFDNPSSIFTFDFSYLK